MVNLGESLDQGKDLPGDALGQVAEVEGGAGMGVPGAGCPRGAAICAARWPPP